MENNYLENGMRPLIKYLGSYNIFSQKYCEVRIFLKYFSARNIYIFPCGLANLLELNKLTPRELGLGHVKGRELGGIVEPSLFIKRELIKALCWAEGHDQVNYSQREWTTFKNTVLLNCISLFIFVKNSTYFLLIF